MAVVTLAGDGSALLVSGRCDFKGIVGLIFSRKRAVTSAVRVYS